MNDEECFAAATKIQSSEWNGHICLASNADPGLRDKDNGGCYESIAHLISTCGDEGYPLPKYVWATKPYKLELDAESILETALEEHHENAHEWISQEAEDDLQAFLDAWCEREDVGVVTYNIDRSNAIAIDAVDRAKFDKLAAERVAYRAKWYSSECSNETP
jgi:hypothetical protein